MDDESPSAKLANVFDMLIEAAGTADAFRLELLKRGWSLEGAEEAANAWLINLLSQ